jgi:peptide chain release factor 2
MAPPEGGRPSEPRVAQEGSEAAELDDLTTRLHDAEQYLRMGELRERRTVLEAEAGTPDLWDDPERARAVTTELGRLGDDVQRFDALLADLGDARVLRELVEEASSSGAPDDGLAKELVQSVADLAKRVGQLELQSLFSGEYDDRDAVCEVHAGAGGTDAQDWAEMLLRMYQRWAERRGFSVEVDEATPGQEAGLLSATFIVRGRFAYGLLATERGVHRLVRMSPFDSQHRRQTSFSSLDVVPFLDDLSDEVAIDEKDLRIDTYRSSGAGGQHVNKTDSAVRLTHLPTGMVVAVQNERSQHQNKAKAMQILAAKLAEQARAERRAELDSLGGERADNAWGNQIRSYVLAPYQLVKDLRTQLETGNVEAVLDGDIDDFMEAELRRQRGGGPPP